MRLSAAVLLGSLCFAAPLRAQSADSARNALVPGTYSLSLTAPGFGGVGDSGSLGFWRMMSGRTNLGLFVELGAARFRSSTTSRDTVFERENEQSQFSISAGPAVRRYLAQGGRTAPFLYASAQVGYAAVERRAAPNYLESTHGPTAEVQGGVGIEWFPTGAVSVSGYTGVRAGASSLDGRFSRGEVEAAESHINTFTTGLSVNIYFVRGR